MMERQARGTFDVILTPSTADPPVNAAIERMTISKRYFGDIEGAGDGQMLTALTAVTDSAGYVALERVTGTLAGRSGSFILQHSGTLNRGSQELSVKVVPDSGTDELEGVSGTMIFARADGRHSYHFDYAFNDRSSTMALR